jgi:hypothetical protein
MIQLERNVALRESHGGISTRLYKLEVSSVARFKTFLESKVFDMLSYKSFEDLFKEFLTTLPPTSVRYVSVIGVAGNVAVGECFIDE